LQVGLSQVLTKTGLKRDTKRKGHSQAMLMCTAAKNCVIEAQFLLFNACLIDSSDKTEEMQSKSDLLWSESLYSYFGKLLMSKMSVKAVSLLVFVFLILLLSACLRGLPFGLSMASQSNELLVAVIVDSKVYDEILTSLQRYKEDVEKSGLSVNITETEKLLNQTKEGVKSYLEGFWRPGEQTVCGALLVGDIAEAWYEVSSRSFPTDAYYMDLDGVWKDTDGNGIYDMHTDRSGPEIWVGRLKVSPDVADQVALLNKYFERNHVYRNGLSTIPWWRALLYMDDFGTAQGHDAITPLSYIAPQIVAVTNGAATNADDYKQRLQDEVGYQWLYLMVHGNATCHTFQVPSPENYYEWDGTVYSPDYETLDPHVSFYQLFVCSAGRYVEEDYLAGAAIFKNDYGLLAIASTDETYTYPYNRFYELMSHGDLIGSAFLSWLRNASADYVQRGSLSSSPSSMLRGSEYEILLHDMVMIGDPTLRLRIENHNLRIANLTATVQDVSEAEVLVVSLTVQNAGDFQENFNVTIHIDSDLVYRSELTLEAGANTTITFSPAESSKYIWSDFIHHRVRAETNVLPHEFYVDDNVRNEYFVSKIIHRSSLANLPDAVFALCGIVAFGLMCYGFLKLLMVDRPFGHVKKLLIRGGIWAKTVLLRKG
jgi:hypothetical protein